MINIYYGKNGICKTRYLRKIQDSIECENLKSNNKRTIVVSNLNIDGSNNRYNYNINTDIENKLIGTEMYQLINNKHRNSKLITTDAVCTAKLMLCQGDVLIIDGIETMFSGPQICNMCIALDDISEYFKEIHIATNSPILREMFYNKPNVAFYICKGLDRIEKIEMEDLYDCEINDFIKR